MTDAIQQYYHAATITRAVLQAVLEIVGAANMSSARLTEPPQWLSPKEVDIFIQAVRSTEEASLFPVGAYQLAALRFVIEDEGRLPVTLLFITGYDRPAPVLVDSHIFERHRALDAWLGGSEPYDHPGLKLFQ